MNKIVGIFITILGVFVAAISTAVVMIWWSSADILKGMQRRRR
jgi:hypothetical protein